MGVGFPRFCSGVGTVCKFTDEGVVGNVVICSVGLGCVRVVSTVGGTYTRVLSLVTSCARGGGTWGLDFPDFAWAWVRCASQCVRVL